MATKNVSIQNKITGEKITWLETDRDTGGKKLVFLFEVAPKGKLAVRHFHPNQTETFKIIQGKFTVEVAGEVKVLSPGNELTIPKNVPHFWQNESDTEATEMLVTFEPALNTQTFLEQFFGLCNEGKTAPDGNPKFLQIMAMVNEYQLYVAGPPLPVQKIMGFVLGGFGRLLGYKKFYKEYSQN